MTARFPSFLLPGRIKRNAFICGCPHSGTTLIANILSSHASIYVPLRETAIFLFDDFKVYRRHLRLLWAAALAGRNTFVEKTPRHLHFLPTIRAKVPGARFIIPVRDGRDSVASMFRRYEDLDRSIERWIHDNEIIHAERDDPTVFVYRHEDLVADPAAVLNEICAFLEVDYSDRLLDFHRQDRLWFGQDKVRAGTRPGREQHHAHRNWQVNQPIFESRGKWRELLSDNDLIEITAGRGRPLMKAFGYL